MPEAEATTPVVTVDGRTGIDTDAVTPEDVENIADDGVLTVASSAGTVQNPGTDTKTDADKNFNIRVAKRP